MNNDQRVTAAKKYAAKQGHYGLPGGWIYNRAGKALCQGWLTYYHERSHLIAFEQSISKGTA